MLYPFSYPNDLAEHGFEPRGRAPGARVPTLPESARGLGMDGVTWAREGLVDMLVPTPFWATADFDIPIEDWRKQIKEGDDGKDASVVLAAGIEILLRAYPAAGQTLNDMESVRGFAASCLHRGADQILSLIHISEPTRPY